MTTATALNASLNALRATIGAIVDRLDQRIDRHTDALRAIENRTRRASVVVTDLVPGNTDVPLSWAVPYADTAYIVIPTLIAGPAALPVLRVGLKPGSKDVGGCVVQVNNTGAVNIATLAVDVLCLRDVT